MYPFLMRRGELNELSLREKQVSRAAGALEQGEDVDLVGARGTGLSIALEALSETLKHREWTVLRVTGTPSLRNTPLAALHAVGIGHAASGRQSTLQLVVDALLEKCEEGRTAILIDDWDDLDEASWGAIEVVKAQRVLPTALTRRPSSYPRRTPSGLAGGGSRPALEVRLERVPFVDFQRVLESMLDGSIESRTASRIYAYTGGNLALAAGFLSSARYTRKLRRDQEGAWSLTGLLWDDSLHSIVADYLGAVPPDEFSTLEALARSPYQRASEAIAQHGDDVLRRLNGRGTIIDFAEDGERRITVMPPILRDYLLEEDIESSQRDEVVSGPLEYELDDADYAAVLVDRLEAHLETARADWRRSRTAKHAYTLGIELRRFGVGSGELQAILASEFSAEEEPYWYAMLEYVRLRMRLAAGSTLEEELQRTNGVDGEPRTLVQSLIRLFIKVTLGGTLGDDDLHFPIPSLTPIGEVREIREMQFSAELMHGHIAHARALHDELSRLQPRGTATSVLNEPFMLIAEGRMVEAERKARENILSMRAEFKLDDMLQARYVYSVVLLLRGRYVYYPQMVARTRTLMVMPASQETMPQAIMHVSACGLARMGKVNEAREIVREAEMLSYKMPDHRVGFGYAYAKAQLHLVQGDADEAANVLWRAAEWHRGIGIHIISLFEAMGSLEVKYDADRFAQLSAWAAERDIVIVDAHVELIGALAAEDPVAIAAAGDRLADMGADGPALRAYNAAEELLRRSGEEDARQQLRARTTALRTSVNRSPSTMIDEHGFLQPYLELTPRETEIAAAVVEGLSNTEVAARLGVSVRTVESHLNRILRKAGVEHRHQLESFIWVLQARRYDAEEL